MDTTSNNNGVNGADQGAPRSRTLDAAPAPAPACTIQQTTAPAYFSFKDYLTDAEATQFFQLSHRAQVDKVTQYLDFLGQQSAAAHFTTSAKASTSFAALRASRAAFTDRSFVADAVASSDATTTWNTRDGEHMEVHESDTCAVDSDTDDVDTALVLLELLDGRTRSGFGAFGTEDGFLPQKQLSLAVARTVEAIGHTYIVERTKRGDVRPPVLNSRSFFFYWCHAEKQKLLDIRLKLERLGLHPHTHVRKRRALWHKLVIVVDRAMCLDCIQFAACFARAEKIYLAIEDPAMLRVFPPDTAQSVQCYPLLQ